MRLLIFAWLWNSMQFWWNDLWLLVYTKIVFHNCWPKIFINRVKIICLQSWCTEFAKISIKTNQNKIRIFETVDHGLKISLSMSKHVCDVNNTIDIHFSLTFSHFICMNRVKINLTETVTSNLKVSLVIVIEIRHQHFSGVQRNSYLSI